MWWNDQVKAAVKIKEAAWKGVSGAKYEDAKEKIWKFSKKKRERLKGVYIKPRRRFMSNLEER